MKKLLLALTLVGVFTLAACGETEEEVNNWEVAYEFTYEDIAEWDPMVTPGGEDDAGSVEAVDADGGFVTIKAGENGWGGLQTPALELDLSRNPLLLVRVHESADEYKWGAQAIIDDHVGEEWALYVINDNGMKWNQFAGGSISDGIGAAYDEYGDVVNLHLWIYPVGSEATMEVTSVTVVYQD